MLPPMNALQSLPIKSYHVNASKKHFCLKILFEGLSIKQTTVSLGSGCYFVAGLH